MVPRKFITPFTNSVHVCIIWMAINIRVELCCGEGAINHVAFEFGHVDAIGGKAAHGLIERSRNIADLKDKTGDHAMGTPTGIVRLAGHDQKAGGVVAAANIIDQLDDLSHSNIEQSLRKLSTIDLRTDFLRPGRGEQFIATAHIIRSGSKVAVARMELHNEKQSHIAFGTGTYMVG